MSYSISIIQNGNTYTASSTGYVSGLTGMYVDFRTDEIVFRYGLSIDKTNITNFPPYTATILSSGTPVATYNLPQHDKYATWIYEINPDTVIRQSAAIFSNDLMFPYGNPGTKVPSAPSNTYTGPLSTAGIDVDMGATGERNDIGLLPEWESYALRTDDYNACLQAAKGFRSMPIFIVDERTQKFWDLTVHPNATMYYTQSAAPDYISSAPQGQWGMDVSHHPAIYVAYLATGKLRHLESLQALANWTYLTTNYYNSIKNNTEMVIDLAQTRAAAWSLRSTILAWKATVLAEQSGSLPSPLLPSTYWRALLNTQLDVFTNGWMNDTTTYSQVFRYFPDVTSYRPWQFDYMLMALALAAYWLPEWRSLYLWALWNPIQRLNGKSGWPPAHQTPYQLNVGPNMPDGNQNFPHSYPTSNYYATWGDAWNGYANAILNAGGGWNMTVAQINALKADPYGGGNFINWDSYTPQTLRNLMACANFLDINGLVPVSSTYPDFVSCYNLISSMVKNWEVQSSGNVIASRVSVISGAPNPPIPPPGSISLPSSVTLNANQSVHLGLQVNGSLVSGPTYSVNNPALGTLTPDPNPLTGVTFKALTAGTAVITASATGSGPLSTTCTVTINPLATSLALVPGVVS